jgi:hypothetical protein
MAAQAKDRVAQLSGAATGDLFSTLQSLMDEVQSLGLSPEEAQRLAAAEAALARAQSEREAALAGAQAGEELAVGAEVEHALEKLDSVEQRLEKLSPEALELLAEALGATEGQRLEEPAPP